MLAMKAPAHPTGIFGENREAPAYFSLRLLEGVFPLGICKAPPAKALRRNKL
ncbi:hypothetical protein FNYG_02357 [Fusarium nygamai]|uniref:Uncharacterized protein n=1 Tax=Gibberella nygamai TaxID=42673 RepID=A0A2K0WPX2_GIBNY|nr:hypothetical protein FNYG_02357 [Fusarium nygamai]